MKPLQRGLLTCVVGLVIGFSVGALSGGDLSVPVLLGGAAVIAALWAGGEWLLLRRERHGSRSTEPAGELGEDR